MDGRPESRHVHQDSIEAGEWIPAGRRGWEQRRSWIDPLVDQSVHALEAAQSATGKSLGIIRPAQVRRLLIKKAEPWDRASDKELDQLTLEWTTIDQPKTELEKLPFDFYYEFTCRDDACHGHTMKVLDWEMSEAYRNFRRRYGLAGWEEKFREKYGVWVPRQDIHLVMGTHRVYQSWMIVGVLYPPNVEIVEPDRSRRRDRSRQEGTMTLPGFGLEAEQRDRFA